MHDDVAQSTAARELGLRPKVLELAVQLGEVRSTAGAAGSGRRVPREELRRLRETAGFPQVFEERLRVVDAGEGAALLGICTARFTRLARGGCFSPVRFYINRYRAVVWLYLARELQEFAGRRPELLAGAAPRGLRVLLGEGADYRPRHWRGRRVGQLCRQAAGRPWEVAAARAAVLSPAVLEEAVPDEGERHRLAALRPELLVTRGESPATREAAAELCVASADDEILWHRLMLEAELQDARAAGRSGLTPADPREAGAEPDASAGVPAGSPAAAKSLHQAPPAGAAAPSSASSPAGTSAERGRHTPCSRPAEPVGTPGASGGTQCAPGERAQPGRPPWTQPVRRALTEPGRRRRAELLNRPWGPGRGAAWWHRTGGSVSRPAFGTAPPA